MTIYRHVMAGQTPGEEWECRMFSNCFLGIDDAQTAWSTAVSAFWAAITTLIATDVTLTSVTTSQLDPTTLRQVTKRSGTLALVGTATTATLPPQCAAGVTWLTDVDTKSGRGRNYLPPLAVASVAAGRIAGASVTIIAGAASDLVSSLIASSCTPVVFSPTLRTTQPIIAGRVGDVFDTQRRRRDKLVPAYTQFSA
jgi:hypothetical protein